MFDKWLLILMLLDEPDPTLREHVIREYADDDSLKQIMCGAGVAVQIAAQLRFRTGSNARWYCKNEQTGEIDDKSTN